MKFIGVLTRHMYMKLHCLYYSGVTGRLGPIPVRTPGRFGPIPFRSGRFGPISGMGRFGPTLAGRFGLL